MLCYGFKKDQLASGEIIPEQLQHAFQLKSSAKTWSALVGSYHFMEYKRWNGLEWNMDYTGMAKKIKFPAST